MTLTISRSYNNADLHLLCALCVEEGGRGGARMGKVLYTLIINELLIISSQYFHNYLLSVFNNNYGPATASLDMV